MAKRISAQVFVSSKITVSHHLRLHALVSQICFLAGLSAYTTDRSLRQLFSPFGQIKEGANTKSNRFLFFLFVN